MLERDVKLVEVDDFIVANDCNRPADAEISFIRDAQENREPIGAKINSRGRRCVALRGCPLCKSPQRWRW